MERQNKSKAKSKGKLPVWQKLTPGTLTLRADKTYFLKPKEVFSAPFEVIQGYKEEFKLIENGTGKYKVDKKDLALEADETDDIDIVYSPQHVGAGKWNLINPDGEKMNDKLLTKEEVLDLKEKLEAK